MKRYRVWTKNYNGSYSIITDWQTYGSCEKVIIGRWGHWPPFAYISQAQTQHSFVVANGK